MKKYIFGCLMTLFCGTTVMAEANYSGSQFNNCCPTDCCSEQPFGGFYVGGNVGVIANTAHRNDYDNYFVYPCGQLNNAFNGGVQVGYDWQRCNSFFGLSADWNWVGNCHRNDCNDYSEETGYNRNEFKWYSTIRARAGVTVCDAIFYLTGGAVVGRFDSRWGRCPESTCYHDTRWGWTAGVGTELDLGCKWSLGGEFSFLQFGNKDRCSYFEESSHRFGHSDSAWVGKITLNYRFGTLCSCF